MTPEEQLKYINQNFRENIATEFGPFLCEEELILGSIKSLFFVGTCIGILVFCLISDNLGRKLGLTLCNLSALVGVLITIFSPNIEIF